MVTSRLQLRFCPFGPPQLVRGSQFRPPQLVRDSQFGPPQLVRGSQFRPPQLVRDSQFGPPQLVRDSHGYASLTAWWRQGPSTPNSVVMRPPQLGRGRDLPPPIPWLCVPHSLVEAGTFHPQLCRYASPTAW
jgi:hypothetical protein